MPKSKINSGLLTEYFASQPEKVFTDSDLEFLFIQRSCNWNLPRSMTSFTFIRMLLSRTKLEKLLIRSTHYSSPVRYGWESKPSPLAVALSLRKHQAFFSHASAMWLHALSDESKYIYLNADSGRW
jgi:hypothetical protein